MKKTIILSLLAIFTLGVMAQTKVKTVADKGGSGRFFAKLCPTTDVSISKDDAKVFSFYLSNGKAYFQSLWVRDAMYVVKAGECVVIFTNEEKEINLESVSGYTSSIWRECDIMFTVNSDQTLEDFRASKGLKPYQYVYRLTNNAATGGFGFTYFTGTTMKAGQFFIITTLSPPDNGRLNVIWVDENGQEIQDLQTTGIQSIIESTSSDDDDVYNLQGVRVTAPQKGQLYIRNGRKFVNN